MVATLMLPPQSNHSIISHPLPTLIRILCSRNHKWFLVNLSCKKIVWKKLNRCNRKVGELCSEKLRKPNWLKAQARSSRGTYLGRGSSFYHWVLDYAIGYTAPGLRRVLSSPSDYLPQTARISLLSIYTGILSRTPQITNPVDAQVSHLKWCSICI